MHLPCGAVPHRHGFFDIIYGMDAFRISAIAAAYLAVALLVFRLEAEYEDCAAERRERNGIPVQRAPIWALALGAILWPFQLIGLVFYMMKG